jgi:hypothetical protein
MARQLRSAVGVLLTPTADDLTATWTKVNVKYRGLRAPQTTVQGTLLVRNGSDRTVGLITVNYYLSLDDQVDAGDQLIARKVVSLPPAGQTASQLRVQLSRGQVVSGLRLIAFIDANHVYTEEDETNNVVASVPLP